MVVTTAFLLSLFGAEPADAAGLEFFEKKIRPVLVERCYECHSGHVAEPKGGLRLDNRESVRRGGESGPAVVPHDIAASHLIGAIRYDALEMPPKEKLHEDTIRDFERWIEMGAPDPRVAAPALIPKANNWPEILAERGRWWSLQPVAHPEVPPVHDPRWASHPVDRFIQAKLAEKGLEPSPRANAQTLVRRLRFFLTGTPPSVEEVSAMSKVSDAEYVAYVDKLLSSPQFGERWARHWMDVVGFGETHGHEWNFELRDVWRYRDYLIRALNQDLPFDRFVLEHIAGDLLPDPRWNHIEGINESLIGTAFLRFGEVDHDDCRLFPALGLDVIDHQIDTLTKAFQATTVACARCHDHKLDAISMEDYYALSGILASSRQVVHTIDSEDRNRASKRRLTTLKHEIRSELAKLWTDEVQAADEYLRAAHAVLQGDSPNDRKRDLDAARLSRWTAMLKAAGDRAAKNTDGEPAWQDVEFPWVHSARRADQAEGLADTWNGLRTRYQREVAERREFNSSHFVDLADFRTELDGRWQTSGLAVRDGVAQSGDFAVACEGDSVVRAILPAGFYSHRLSSRFNACLRSPVMPQDKRFVSFEVLGGDGGVWRNVYNNCAIQNAISKKLESDNLQWQRLSTTDDGVRLVIEFATRFDDQGYPYLNHNQVVDPHDVRSFFGVTRVVAHDCEQAPKSELHHLRQLLCRPTPSTMSDVADRYAEVLREVVAAWSSNAASDAHVRWINWMLHHKLLTNSRESTKRLNELTCRYREIEAHIKPARVVSGVSEFDVGFDVPLRIGGDPFRPGATVPRRYVQVLSRSKRDPHGTGSGRLQLARQIASAENPLTPRVIVNRVWHHIFGSGLVRTTDDFGRLGERPSHPELLDYLSWRFVEDGWSVKRLIRLLVSSQAFQMSGVASRAAMRQDPANRLLHHYPMRRLEAEAIRDSILAVSGRFDRRLYGRSIHPHRFEERPMRRLFSGPVDGQGRRSIYIKVTLTEEPPFLSVFNLADPKATKGRRDVTNVPAQALALLNDPFVIQQAEVWARRLVAGNDSSVDDRIIRMFVASFARQPCAAEVEHFRDATETFARLHQVPAAEILRNDSVWKELAHTMFNTKEFIFIP